MEDNLDPVQDNLDPAGETGGGVAVESSDTFSWKGIVGADLSNSPLLQKFEDGPEGLRKQLESHANLEKMIGQDKVPIPKSPDDVEGWNRLNKALGVPDAAEGYGLPDAELPEGLKGLTFDKQQFADIVHSFKLTPSQAKGLWGAYTKMSMDAYGKVLQSTQTNMTDVVNRLRGEWGDAYESNVELGQTVINKFSDDKETNDWLTSRLASDPRGVKFLAKIGNQFAENKIGEFQFKRFSLAPDEAIAEINKIRGDINGAYMNASGKFSEEEHQAAVAQVNRLLEVAAKAQG